MNHLNHPARRRGRTADRAAGTPLELTRRHRRALAAQDPTTRPASTADERAGRRASRKASVTANPNEPAPAGSPQPGSKRWRSRTVGRADAAPARSGWVGAGRGTASVVQAAPEFRAVTNMVCGLWPFAAGTGGTPQIGAPLGNRITRNGQPGRMVCGDPISWFRHKLILNPSAFMLALPSLGKTQTVMRKALSLSGFGVIPMVLGDIRPDYVRMIRGLGGQVITLGDGRHFLNILDPGQMPEAITRLHSAARTAQEAGQRERAFTLQEYAAELQEDFQQRRKTMLFALLEISRGGKTLKAVEKNILTAALHHLDDAHDGVPILADLLQVIRNPTQAVRRAAVDRGKLSRYQKKTEKLEEDLTGLVDGGGLGTTFSRHTTEPMRRDRPVVYDISAITATNKPLLSAALLACWSTGFGTVNVATVLADAGLEPRRHYFLILDELHRALQAGGAVIDYLDLLTRLNRAYLVGQIMITHTMNDLYALAKRMDRLRAGGFVSRAGMLLLGGLPPEEMKLLAKVVRLGAEEQALLTSWSAPGSIDEVTGEETPPPGRGNFMVKVGHAPGIPFHMSLTSKEWALNASSEKWATQSRIGSTDTPTPERETV